MANSRKEILVQQLTLVNESLKLTTISSLVLGSVISLQIYREFNQTTFLLWLVIFTAPLLFRIYLLAIHKKRKPSVHNLGTWVKLNHTNSLLSGFSYGFAAGSTYFMENHISIVTIYIISAGVSAGAVTAYGTVKKLSLYFLIPIIIPLVVANVLHMDLDHLLLAVIVLLFLYIVYSVSSNLHKTFLATMEQGIMIRELTKEKVKLEESENIKRDFFASMSHEIRTPLNGIIGLVDLLLQSKLDKDQSNYLETIKNSSGTLLNVINDVLDLSKIETGKLELLPRPTNLTKLTENTINLFKSKAAEKGLELKSQLDNHEPKWVQIDEYRIAQVLNNLLSNAIKFTNVGSVTLVLDFEQKSGNSARITFRVIDTGLGIPPEKQAMVFNKYDQIASSENYTITQVGTGLGLSVSKKIVELMDGKIGVESPEGKGSTFWFSFTAPLAQAIESKSKSHGNTAFSETKTILLVDDRSVNLKVTSLMLKKLNCKIITAENGEEAIKLYEAHQKEIDLILMDIQMPVMDGLTATKLIREKYGDQVLIIGLSAQIEGNLHESPKSLGFNDYLTKPLGLDKLEETLQRHL